MSVGEEVVLAARGLRVRRGDRAVLDGVHLSLARGEIAAVRGPSGSGKSTLLSALCGLLPLKSGTVQVLGQVTSKGGDSQRARSRLRDFGLVFQGDELVPELTLTENVSLPLRLLSRPGADETARAELARLDIEELGDRLPAEVSGGQAQRAAVARAVVHEPKVVLADEPTSALDEETAGRAMQLLIDLARRRDIAVLVVTHDRGIATACDRVLVLQDGQLNPAGQDASGSAV